MQQSLSCYLDRSCYAEGTSLGKTLPYPFRLTVTLTQNGADRAVQYCAVSLEAT